MTILHDVYQRLLEHFGPQHWWRGESSFEIMLGAMLVQNTAWKNVERALENLREADVLSLHGIHSLPQAELEELIRPAGYYRVKASRVRNLTDFLYDRYAGSLEAMFAVPVDELREQLLGIRGVGPETADSILLYAGGLQAFVVDTYTHRALARHGWIDFETDYHALQDHFVSSLAPDVQLYNEYHALLVQLGKTYCRKTPQCNGCPLAPLLPECGPLQPDF